MNDYLTVDYAGPGWRRKTREKEWEGEASDAIPPIDEQLSKMQALKERRRRIELLFDRLAISAGKTPERIKEIIQKEAISDIKSLGEKLRIPRPKLYDRVIKPTREEK